MTRGGNKGRQRRHAGALNIKVARLLGAVAVGGLVTLE